MEVGWVAGRGWFKKRKDMGALCSLKRERSEGQGTDISSKGDGEYSTPRSDLQTAPNGKQMLWVCIRKK